MVLKAFREEDSRGRRREDDEKSDGGLLLAAESSLYRSDFYRMKQSRALRRLGFKTQVLCFPENPHVRTRRVHTDEVEAVSETIAENLGLNMDLCRAIALGHDMGHTPYGHMGENVLKELSGKPFSHPAFGIVVLQEIEARGRGLNLAYETLQGILNHSRGRSPLTAADSLPNECIVVMYADKIAYTFSDLNDALRYGMIDERDLPSAVERLGINQRERNDNTIRALLDESLSKGRVSFSEGDVFEWFQELRDFMWNNVYAQVNWSHHKGILKEAYRFFEKHYPDADPVVCVALLTDREAQKFGNILHQTMRPNHDDIRNFGVVEIMPYIKGRSFNYSNPTLDW